MFASFLFSKLIPLCCHSVNLLWRMTSWTFKICKTFQPESAQILIPILKSKFAIQVDVSYFKSSEVLLMDWANTNWQSYWLSLRKAIKHTLNSHCNTILPKDIAFYNKDNNLSIQIKYYDIVILPNLLSFVRKMYREHISLLTKVLTICWRVPLTSVGSKQIINVFPNFRCFLK